MYNIVWTDYFKDDYEKLEGSQKVLVDKALNRIKINGMNSAEPLSGNLAKCNRYEKDLSVLKYKDGQVFLDE